MRLQFLHEPFHSSTLKLEHTICLTGSDIRKYLFVVIVNLIHIQFFSGGTCHIFHGILDYSQCPESEEIHLQKPQLLQCRHGKLCRHGTIGASRERHILVHRFLTDHHTGCMHGRMPRQSLQTQ